jgi:hypothetical protein
MFLPAIAAASGLNRLPSTTPNFSLNHQFPKTTSDPRLKPINRLDSPFSAKPPHGSLPDPKILRDLSRGHFLITVKVNQNLFGQRALPGFQSPSLRFCETSNTPSFTAVENCSLPTLVQVGHFRIIHPLDLDKVSQSNLVQIC